MPAKHSISSTKIALPTAKGLVFFALADLLYFVADDKECVLYFKEKKTIKTITVFKGLSVINARLASLGFLLVRRNVLINTNHILYISTDKTIVMADGKTIHPSLRKIPIMERYIDEHFGV